MKRLYLIFILSIFTIGCSFFKMQIPTPQPPLLDKDRIYTIPKGTEVVTLYLDGKQMGPISFNFDMKLVSPNVLLEQEEKLNKTLFEKAEIEKRKGVLVRNLIALILVLLIIFGYFRSKDNFKK